MFHWHRKMLSATPIPNSYSHWLHHECFLNNWSTLTFHLSGLLYNRVLLIGSLGRVSSGKLINRLPRFARRLNETLLQISAQSRQVLTEL